MGRRKAKSIGLVDELGGLEDAISWTAKRAKLGDNFDVALYPKTTPTLRGVFAFRIIGSLLRGSGQVNKPSHRR